MLHDGPDPRWTAPWLHLGQPAIAAVGRSPNGHGSQNELRALTRRAVILWELFAGNTMVTISVMYGQSNYGVRRACTTSKIVQLAMNQIDSGQKQGKMEHSNTELALHSHHTA